MGHTLLCGLFKRMRPLKLKMQWSYSEIKVMLKKFLQSCFGMDNYNVLIRWKYLICIAKSSKEMQQLAHFFECRTSQMKPHNNHYASVGH